MASLTPEVLKAIHDAVEAETRNVGRGLKQGGVSASDVESALEDAGFAHGAAVDIFFLLICGYMVRAGPGTEAPPRGDRGLWLGPTPLSASPTLAPPLPIYVQVFFMQLGFAMLCGEWRECASGCV